jgi:DNA-binding NarL/FixJ family response regulator
MSHQLKKLLPRHKKILELCLQGKTFVEIAKEVMMSPRAISYIYKSPVFMNEFRFQMWKRTFENRF